MASQIKPPTLLKQPKHKKSSPYNIFCIFKSPKTFKKFQQKKRQVDDDDMDFIYKNNEIQQLKDQIPDLMSIKYNISRPNEFSKKFSITDSLISLQIEDVDQKNKKKYFDNLDNVNSGISSDKSGSKNSDSKNLTRFVQRILDYKTGILNTYQPSRQRKIQRYDSMQSIQSVSMHNTMQQKALQISTFPQNTVSNILRNISVLQQHSQEQSVEYQAPALGQTIMTNGYFCNGCSISPILGLRYHCNSCQDYDLCVACYFTLGHHHGMSSFGEGDISFRQKEKFQQTLNNSIQLQRSQNIHANAFKKKKGNSQEKMLHQTANYSNKFRSSSLKKHQKQKQ